MDAAVEHLKKMIVPPGWLHDQEITKLFVTGRLLPKVNPVIVEIGSWLGRSSAILACSIIDRVDPMLYCVDPWKGGEGVQYDKFLNAVNIKATDVFSSFWSNMERAGVDQVVQPCPGTSEEWASNLRHLAIDMIFIDGDHHEEAVRRDIRLWVPMLKPGGILAMHDVYTIERMLDPGAESGPVAALQELQPEQWTDREITWTLFTARKV